MNKKYIVVVLLSLCIFLNSCTSQLSLLQKHEYTFVVEFEEPKDEEVFSKRLQAYMLEINSIDREDNIVTYKCESNIIDETGFEFLDDNFTLSITNPSGKEILDTDEITYVYFNLVYMIIGTNEEYCKEFIDNYGREPALFLIDGRQYTLYIYTEPDNVDEVRFINREEEIVALQKATLCLCAPEFQGDVRVIEIEK